MEQIRNKNKKFNLDKAIRSNAMPFNLGITIAAIIVDCLLLYIMVSINSYSAFSKTVFMLINVIIMMLMLGLNAMVFFFIKTKKVRLFQIATVFLALLMFITVPGSFLTMKVQGTVNKVINTSGEETQSVTTSIVVYGDEVSKLDALNGKMLGIVPETTYATKAQEQLNEKEIPVTTVEFDSFTTLLLALVGGEVDAAALPGNYAAMYGNDEGLKDKIKSLHSLLDFETVVKNEVKDNSGKDLTKEPFSVLILGNADGNTDAIIVASFNPVSMTLTMTSIARDTWVPICGKGSNKINAAYAYGGVSCVMKTVEDFLDIELDFYFMANFKGVVKIVDAIGGIVVNNPYEFVGQDSSSERGHKTVWIPAGENVPLNGEQALAFARERKLYASGDFQRQRNQQQVISAILTKALRVRDLNTMIKILDAAGDNIETNISKDQLIDLFNYVMKKIDRWQYKDEHPERVINIIGSRVTGYNSSVWSDAAGLALSIVQPYEGSIKDNRNAFLRNMWQDKTTKQLRSMILDASYEFMAPTVSNETYSEAIKQSETPPSYWCSITGGTFANGSCACPVGTQFISEKGCQEVQTDFTKLTDEASCIAGSGKWSYDTNTCYSACPSGYVEATFGYCSVNTCSADNPKGCLDEQACKASGNEWKDNYCTAPQKCDLQHLNRCDNESACTGAGGLWNGSTCGQPKSEEQKACELETSGGTWKDGKCTCTDANKQWNSKTGKCEDKVAACSSNNLKACDTVDKCKGLGNGFTWDDKNKVCKSNKQLACEADTSKGTWDATTGKCKCPSGTIVSSDGSCKVSQTTPPETKCSLSNLAGCKDEQSCKAIGKFWYDNKCNANEQQTIPPETKCSLSNLSGCKDEQSCKAIGKFWYENKCNANEQQTIPSTKPEQPQDVCSPSRLDLCGESNCSSEGKGYWYDNACHIDPKSELTPEQKCQIENGVWYNGQCYADWDTACKKNGLVHQNGACVTPQPDHVHDYANVVEELPATCTEGAKQKKCCSQHPDECQVVAVEGSEPDKSKCDTSTTPPSPETATGVVFTFDNKPKLNHLGKSSVPTRYQFVDFSAIKRISL